MYTTPPAFQQWTEDYIYILNKRFRTRVHTTHTRTHKHTQFLLTVCTNACTCLLYENNLLRVHWQIEKKGKEKMVYSTLHAVCDL